MPEKRTCFFITPIGSIGSPARTRADQIQKYILSEVLGKKFDIVRADEMPEPGSITHQIIKLLFDADLVVADLTGANPNVIYELAIRHAFNKISIHLVDKADKIPFDLKDERSIPLDINNLDSVNRSKDELQRVVEAMQRRGGVRYHSPIFRALGIAAASEQNKDDFLEEMAGQIDLIALNVDTIESNLSDVGLIHSDLDLGNLNKDLYDIKLDIRKILGRLK